MLYAPVTICLPLSASLHVQIKGSGDLSGSRDDAACRHISSVWVADQTVLSGAAWWGYGTVEDWSIGDGSALSLRGDEDGMFVTISLLGQLHYFALLIQHKIQW